MTLQDVLTERSDELFEAMKDAASAVEKDKEWMKECQRNPLFQSRFHLEVAFLYSKFYFVEEAGNHVSLAAEAIGFKMSETGAMGRRTKFQVKDLAQFTLDVEQAKSVDGSVDGSLSTEDLPRDIKLDDEVRLDKIKFTDSDRNSRLLSLGPTEQAVVLAMFTIKQHSMPKDELTHEELAPYLEAILGSASRQCWALRFSALLCRSKLEGRERRTVERSLAQVETLVESLKATDIANRSQRLNATYVSRLPPFWQVESELCRLYQSLGSTKAALDIALRLRQWDDVIHCYHLLQLRHKAAEVIREQLEKKETAMLYCMLGDATDELEHYHKALEMTGGRSSRAHRALGFHYYYRKDYVTAVEHMKKSLELCSFQLQLLLRLGYAALEVEDWETAAMAYRKYCVYESDVRTVPYLVLLKTHR